MATPQMAASSCTDAWTGKHQVVLVGVQVLLCATDNSFSLASPLRVLEPFQMGLFSPDVCILNKQPFTGPCLYSASDSLKTSPLRTPQLVGNQRSFQNWRDSRWSVLEPVSVLEGWHIAEESNVLFFGILEAGWAVCVHGKTTFKVYFYGFSG